MTDEKHELDEAVARLGRSMQRRGHAPWFHATNEFQSAMEVHATAEWARTLSEQTGNTISHIRKNPDLYPDCLAEMDRETIGIEVTELVDRDAIGEFQRTNLEQWPGWSLDKFRDRLEERIHAKDMRSRAAQQQKQFLLIVTGEPSLDEETLAQYISNVTLTRPKNFDGIYVLGSYVPRGGQDGYYPVFAARFAPQRTLRT